MPYKRPSKRRPSWIRAPLIFLGVLYVIAFWQPIRGVFELFWAVLKMFLGRPNVQIPLNADRHLAIVTFTIFLGFLAIFFMWLFIISTQALLPVKKFRKNWGTASHDDSPARRARTVSNTTPHNVPSGMYPGWAGGTAKEDIPQLRLPPELSNLMEELRTSWHLLLYILRLHGMAVFVRDGQVRATLEELQRHGPGVSVIDFNSAVVFEEMVPPPGLSRPFRNIIIQTLITLGLSDPMETPRARGAGIVFTRRRERIRGAVDLRRQFRLRPGVPAYTRDGIELKAAVWILFTIGQEPDVLEVTYMGERRPENLRVLRLERLDGGKIRITGVSDTLEEDDRNEINHFFWVDNRRNQFWSYEPTEPPAPLPVFDPNRVYAAVSSQARNNEEQVVPWSELPLELAIDSYRNIMHSVNYNEFFGEQSDTVLPLLSYRAKQRMAMVNNGILAYRHVRHHTGAELQTNTIYRENELRISAIRQLSAPKLLRDRGVKVIASGFGELVPVDDAIYRQRLESWRAPHKKGVDVVHAQQDLEAMRIRSRVRAEAQRSLTHQLATIMQKHPHSEEIVALRILQALESAASDPHTQQLLPSDTIALMRTIRDWLLPGESRFPPPV
jgi:hypothetical protein